MSLFEHSPEATAHQQQLLAYLSQQLQAQNGIMSFADFMQIALYAPGLGYYSAGQTKLGAQGDFVTAPEISALFSQALANQCAQILNTLAKDDAIILELGAGRGLMAADLLKQLAADQCLPKQYWILEVSADLKAQQQAYLQAELPEYFTNIVWLNSLPQQPFCGIIVANEVLDAMSVHLFQIQNDGILEGCVRQADHQFLLEYVKPITSALIPAVQQLQQYLGEALPAGYQSELNLGMSGLIQSLNQSLQQGVMIFIDYGFPNHEYYHPSRYMGTLMCHSRHRAHPDPMQSIGLQDITAHVDFTALALAANACQLEVAGFTHQAGFLLDNGILTLGEKSQQSPLLISQQIQRLTHPHEMGELFKIMALNKNIDAQWQGFQSFDRRHRL